MKYTKPEWNWTKNVITIATISGALLLSNIDQSHTEPPHYNTISINSTVQMEQRSGPTQVGSLTDWSDFKSIRSTLNNGLYWMW